MLCVNPVSGAVNGEAEAADNLGALIPNEDMNGANLTPGVIPARCDEQGLLLVGQPPVEFGRYILPGNNYHVFDYMLFWSNLRADVERRVANFVAASE